MPTEPGAINGGMFERTEQLSSPVITIDVEAIDDALKQIEDSGGSTVAPRTPIPGMGAFAYFKDSEGNVLGLWENTPSERACSEGEEICASDLVSSRQ